MEADSFADENWQVLDINIIKYVLVVSTSLLLFQTMCPSYFRLNYIDRSSVRKESFV